MRLIFLTGIAVGLAVGLLLPLVVPASPLPPPPVEWVHDTYQQGMQLCPGDRVSYVLGIRHERDAVIRFAASIDRANDHPVVNELRESEVGQALSSRYGASIVGDTVTVSQSPVAVVISGGKTTEIRIDPDGVFTAPDLDPGPYVRNLAVWEEGRPAQIAIRQQKFTIKDGCNDGDQRNP